MIVRQHIPNFVDGVEPERHEVQSQAELEALEFVHRWTLDPGFHRLAVDRNYWPNWAAEHPLRRHLLLAEFDGGHKWWVLAYLSGPDALEVIKGLPEWEPKN